MAGDATPERQDPEGKEVSIHTRHEWRVMLALIQPVGHLDLFQSTPAMNGG